MVRISVVIPTIPGRESSVARALASVRRQSKAPFETILVVNGQESVQPAEPSVAELGPTVIINTVNRAGPAQARNIGATWASGDVLCFLDDDDYWKEKYLSWVSNAFDDEERTEFVVGSLHQLVDEIEAPFKSIKDWLQLNPKVKLQQLLRNNPGITGSNISIRRSTFISLCGFDVFLPPGEDKGLALAHIIGNGAITHVPSAVAVMDNSDRTDRASNSASLSVSPLWTAIRFRREASISTLVYLFLKFLWGRSRMWTESWTKDAK